jgi:hypothetical protein
MCIINALLLLQFKFKSLNIRFAIGEMSFFHNEELMNKIIIVN